MVAALSIPACLFDLLFLFNSVNPLQVAFMQLGLLPLYAWALPAIPALREGGFTIEPRGVHRVRYDWDDYNFNFILIQTRGGQTLTLPVDEDDPKSGCCWRHRKQLYVVPQLNTLRPATAWANLLNGEPSIWRMLLPALFIPVLALLLRHWRRATLHAVRSSRPRTFT